MRIWYGRTARITDGLSSEPTGDYASFLSPSRWREQWSVINRGFRRCGRSYPGNNWFILNKPVPGIPAFVIVTGPGIVPLSTRKTYVEEPQPHLSGNAEAVLLMEERIGAVRSKWMEVATEWAVTANVMVLIPVLERKQIMCHIMF